MSSMNNELYNAILGVLGAGKEGIQQVGRNMADLYDNPKEYLTRSLQNYADRLSDPEQAAELFSGGGIAGMYVGRGAKNWASLPNKFSSLADKMPRSEITDHLSKLNIPNKSGTYKLSDILKHDLLFESYPELKNLPIEVTRRLKSNTGVAWHSKYDRSDLSKMRIQIHPDSPDSYKTFFHELQHIVNNIEMFPRGGKGRLKSYRQQAGEIEARDTSRRISLTPEERLSDMPFQGEGIPLKDWEVRGLDPRIINEILKSVEDIPVQAKPVPSPTTGNPVQRNLFDFMRRK